MSETYSYEDALKLAKLEVLRKAKQDKMFTSGDESPESEDFTDGDPETLFSIALLYAQFVDDDFNNACDALLDALQDIYPQYI